MYFHQPLNNTLFICLRYFHSIVNVQFSIDAFCNTSFLCYMSSNYYVYCYAPNTQPDSDSFILAKVTFVQVEVEDDEVVTSSTLTSATKV